MSIKSRLISRIKNNVRLKHSIVTVMQVLPKKKKIIRGKNIKIYTKGSFLRKVKFDIIGDANEVMIEKGANVSNVNIFMRGTGHKLVIGKKCVIKSGEFWFEDGDCSIIIGDKTTIENAHIAVTEPNSIISIGEDCMLSSGIDIRNGDSHSIIDIETSKRINYAKDISIENHVWVGKNVQILKGVKIGSNSIIGVRSVVTKDVPNSTIVTGVPAKVVKENVTWDRERITAQ